MLNGLATIPQRLECEIITGRAGGGGGRPRCQEDGSDRALAQTRRPNIKPASNNAQNAN